MQLAFSNDNRMFTSLATSKAVSQGEALMLKFSPCFVCISSVKMGKWFRIFKRQFFVLLGLFKGHAELQMQISESQIIDHSSLHLKLILLSKKTKKKPKLCSVFLFPLSFFIYFSFLFVRRPKKV